ncbi:MAG: TM1812 family CRISPR-associated protein [Pseudomonadota bacterium]
MTPNEEIAEHLVPNARDPAAMWDIVRRVLDPTVVQDGDLVWLETTGGLRPISTGFQLAALLLVSLRPAVRVLAATYAEFPPGSGRGLVYDLLPFFEVASQAPAMAALGQRLDARPLATYLRERPWGVPLARSLTPVSDALDMGWAGLLGVSLGRLGKDLQRAQQRLDSTRAHLPELAFEQLEPLLRAIPAGARGDFTEATLVYELQLFSRLVGANREAKALRLLRETLVSMMVLAGHRASGEWGPCRNVLDLRVRGQAEAAWFRLGGPWGRRWACVAALRNLAAHGDTREARVSARSVRAVCRHRWVGDLSGMLVKPRWWVRFTKPVVTAPPLWLVDLPGPSGPPGAVECRLPALKPGKAVGKGWAADHLKKLRKQQGGVPSALWLTLHPVRAASLAAACHAAGIPVFAWDGQQGVQFPSPWS